MAYINATASLCIPSTFSPVLYGASILNVSASLVTNYSKYVPDTYNYNHPSLDVVNATFCNVTVTYTHPDQNDNINVETWLPLGENYNGRLQAAGGGGWIAGRFVLSYYTMTAAIGEGYAAMTTDAGLGYANDPTSWAQVSEGNVNLYNLQNFGSVSLYDEAIIAKSLIQDYYGQPPLYSYWSGCSQGGRQGLMLAQRYPDIYDGIAASAPATNWGEFIPSIFYPQLVMNLLGEYPRACELDFLATAAIDACDPLDGIADGLISDMDACSFDPFPLVNTIFTCKDIGINITLTEAAATVSNVSWTGPHSANGSFIWYGYGYGADISGDAVPGSVAATTCFDNGTCVGAPSGLGTEWISYFVEKNPSYQYDNIISPNDPDLSEFRDAGGKMLAYHGLEDDIIPPGGTEHYYKAVTEVTRDVHDFYRFYKVPGLQHCSGGNGGQPTAIWAALRAWVEN